MPRKSTDSRACSDLPHVQIADVTPHQLMMSLRSTVCPMCGGPKKSAQTLCFLDYKKLPHEVKVALYDDRLGAGYKVEFNDDQSERLYDDRLGAGYEEAVADAFKARRASAFVLPADLLK